MAQHRPPAWDSCGDCPLRESRQVRLPLNQTAGIYKDEPSHSLEVIKVLSEKLRDYYIFSDEAGNICAGPQKHLEEGDYNGITDGDFFACALTTHMQEICHDEHLWVRWSAI